MLTIMVGATSVFDETDDRFREDGGFELQLEHSLVTLSKWESEYEKPFLANTDKTADEVLAYIRYMVQSPNPPEDFLEKLTQENVEAINAYINKKMTATWFNDLTPRAKRNSEVVTAELVYYWMTVFRIDWEAQHWHFNKLMTLVRICNLKNDNSPKKMTRGEIQARNRELNAQRRAQMGTKG